MHLDKISEAIAHFIGLFQTETEQARLRDDYLEFKALRAAEQPAQPDDHAPLSFQSPYEFDDPEPNLHYVPVAPTLETLMSPTDVTDTPLGFPVGGGVPLVSYPDYVPIIYPFLSSGVPVFELQPPGSVASHIAQINNLSDNDIVNVGAGQVAFHPIGAPNIALDALVHDAAQFLPIPPASFSSEADIGSFVSDTAAALSVFSAEITSAALGGAPADGSAIVDGISIQTIVSLIDNPVDDATYVDGQVAAAAPKLDDVLPSASLLAKQAAETPADTGLNGNNHLIDGSGTTAISGTALGHGNYAGDTSIDLNTGSNALVNSATVINEALEGGVFAVAGNHFSLNAIIQINAWSDSDAIGASLSGWGGLQHSPTTAFNIADMTRIDAGDAAASGDSTHALFPQAWAVTEIKGDFVSLNWAQQFNFVTDNDTVVASSSHGVTTEVGTGGNQSFNDLSIADLGKYYDLVLVGGNYYDANVITQTNVLLDNDIVGSVAGFHTTGQGSVSTGGNLLWNDASITSIGHDGADGLPDGFAKALHDFGVGDHTLSSDVLNDSAFQGLAGLKVLYISGSIYDLQYVQQTNVLGDADQVALAMNAAQPNIGGDWSVTTGSNALINSAQIVDADPAAKTYAGGDHYSDELLVQTDIIHTDHSLETVNADHLVNEAVAFLSDDMIAPHQDDSVSLLKNPLDVHPGHSDIMQSVIS